MDRKTRRTRTFIGLMVLAAITAAVYAGIGSHALHPYYALAVLALAAATSRMRVKLPGIEGNMSVNLPFLLMAVLSVSAAEAVLIASFSTVVQCWPQSSGKFHQDLFSGDNREASGFATLGDGGHAERRLGPGTAAGHAAGRLAAGHGQDRRHQHVPALPTLQSHEGNEGFHGKTGRAV